MSNCVGIDPDCAECERTAKRRGADHECGDLCDLFREGLADPEAHAAYHRAERCHQCGAPKYDEDGNKTYTSRLCKHGRCVEWHCAWCDTRDGGYGPVACPCNTSWWTRLVLRLKGVKY